MKPAKYDLLHCALFCKESGVLRATGWQVVASISVQFVCLCIQYTELGRPDVVLSFSAASEPSNFS